MQRFSRLDNDTQSLAIRQLRNPGRSTSPQPAASRRRAKDRVGSQQALPFDWSKSKPKKKESKTKIDQKPADADSKVEALTSSNISHELEATLRMADTYGMYIKCIARHPLLTAEEEVLLGQTIEDGLEAKKALAAKDFSKGSQEELKWIIQQGDSAFSTFVLANLRLVVWTAKKYFVPDGMTFMDLVQEGNLGLLRSIEKWDWRRGHRFSTYSTWWIRQAIDRGTSMSRVIRLPEHMKDNVRKLKKAASQFFIEHQRHPSQEELADRLGMSVEKYSLVAKQMKAIVSLDAPMKGGAKASKSGEGSKALLEVVRTQTQVGPEAALMTNDLHEGIHHVVDLLTERQAYVIKKRFGLDGGKSMTLQEVGDLMGVTRERVRQIEAKAMHELQTSSRIKDSLADLHANMLDVEDAADGIYNDFND
jgi:RNA polymerase primary sigma factor